MIAWATASVTTSASVTLRLAFLARSGRRSSAVANTAVRSKSRSASIVAPRVDGENYGTDRLRLLLTKRLPRPSGRGINHLARWRHVPRRPASAGRRTPAEAADRHGGEPQEG